ncbi:MAG: cytochrome c biogenesis protein CcdA [Patescibacteria group bacterium]
MFYLVLINGLVDSFNPCAIGVLIFYLTLVLSLKVERKSFITFGLFYVLATFATYFLIGLGILRVMHLFGIHNFFGWAAAVLILILGLFNLKEFFFPFWTVPFLSSFFNKCRVPKWKPEFTVLSAIVLGFLIGLCEFPCSGGIYLATVSLLTVKATFLKGVLYLLLYNLMFILPLVALFLSVSNKKVFNLFQGIHEKTSRYAKLGMGLSMLVSGILLLIWLLI